MAASDISVKEEGNSLTIRLPQEFNYACHSVFYEAYRNKSKSMNFVVDMSRTDSIDSAGLGLLINLQNYAGEDKTRVKLIVHSDYVKSVLTITNFANLFTIEYI
jgi:anti-anti-sigma factor